MGQGMPTNTHSRIHLLDSTGVFVQALGGGGTHFCLTRWLKPVLSKVCMFLVLLLKTGHLHGWPVTVKEEAIPIPSDEGTAWRPAGRAAGLAPRGAEPFGQASK